MWYLVALFALFLAAPTDVTVTKLDGSTATGELQAWKAGGVELLTSAGSQTVSADELLELKFAAPAGANLIGPQVELVDGSLLPILEYTASGSQADVKCVQPPPEEAVSLKVPLQKVRAVRLQTLEPEAAPQWEEIRSLNAPGDVVVVAKRGGKSLDHLECVVREISEEDVELTVDGQTMRVPRNKVAGVIYYRPDEPQQPAAIVAGIDGLRIVAGKVELLGQSLAVTTLCGVKLAWPLAGVAAIDLSAGKLAFLGDLKPASVKWLPLVGLPSAATQALRLGEPRFNRAAGGGELTLAYRDANPAIGSRDIKTFAKGLAVRSRSEIIYRLQPGYSRFLAEAGIDPDDSASGNVQLTIFGDEEPLVEKSIDGSDSPVLLDLDVTGVKRLRIVVDYGDNLDTGDWLNLCNARIVK